MQWSIETSTSSMTAVRIHLIYSSILSTMSISRMPVRRMLPLQPVRSGTYASTVRNYSIFKDWKGSDENTAERSKKGDTTDVHAKSSASGMQERKDYEGIADESKSQGTTERGGSKHSKKAKEEHPKAPEPIIGMNDERPKASPLKLVQKCQASCC